MREALALVGEEGLENMWKRHQRLHEDLWKGLGELGLEPFVKDPKDRLATVNTVKVRIARPAVRAALANLPLCDHAPACINGRHLSHSGLSGRADHCPHNSPVCWMAIQAIVAGLQ